MLPHDVPFLVSAASRTIIKIEGKLPRLVFPLPFRNCERDKNRLKKRREGESRSWSAERQTFFSSFFALFGGGVFGVVERGGIWQGEGEEKRKRIPEVLNLEVETIETATALHSSAATRDD